MLEWNLAPQNMADNKETTCANKLTQVIRDIPYFQQFRRCLLEAIFFGKYGVQLLGKWDYSLGYRRMIIADWYPVNGDKIVFKYDGTPGILINPSYKVPTSELTERGPAHFLTADQQDAFIYHKFEPEDAGYYQPQFAGSVHGSGMRGRIYWYWWLRNNIQKFMMSFLKKLGNGFLLAGYESGNVSSQQATQFAIEKQEGNNVLYVPLKPGGSLDTVIKHLPISTTGTDMQWTVITGINEMIRSAILGEDLTTRSSATGLGSNLAEQHGVTADERIKYDATDLETPMNKLVHVLNKKNCPMNPPPRFQHLADKRNPDMTMGTADFAMKAGLAIPQSWIKDQLGIPDPVNNEPVLALVQPQQATAVGNTPGGTPMVGPSGPAGG